jgi:AmmeMemoRadiSam system protein A
MQSLSEPERQSLLRLARDSIIAAVSRTLPKSWPTDGVFAERCGVFVTVRVNHQLRGCIGVVESDEPLGDAVVRCAACAASQDPRFPPLTADDLAGLQIEISLLSKPVPLRVEEIELGKHGLMVVQGTRRGLLLPQVATEHRLTVEQFLAETCRKAGLRADAWQEPDTQIFGFTCELLSDSIPINKTRVH